MKVRVIKRYVDKNTRFIMDVGEKAEYEPERAEKLIKDGYVEEVKDKPKAEKKEPEKAEE